MTKDAATLRQEDYKFKAAQQGLDTNKIKSYPSYQSKMPVEQNDILRNFLINDSVLV